MISHFAFGLGAGEAQALEVFRRYIPITQLRIAGEAEAPIIGRVAKQHAAFRACGPKALQPVSNERLADAASLLCGLDRDGSQSEPAACLTVDRDRRERHVADDPTLLLGDEGERQCACIPERVDDRRLGAAAVGRTLESRGRDGPDCGSVLGHFGTDDRGEPRASDAKVASAFGIHSIA
jgi:hypothetical protein